MNNETFLAGVRRIADARPVYRTGGKGADGTCDCIGLIIGALGQKYDMHSTNYFARYQMRTKDILLDESQLHEGSVVYKSRRDTSQLSARYQPGGTHHADDPLDYYHAGVVTKIDPLEITHCTSANDIDGIAYDNSIRAWSHFGDLLDVEYTEEEVSMEIYTATVTARSGSTVRMRSRPDADAPTVVKVPIGQAVQVLESASGWSKVNWNGQRGYMMVEFLQKQEKTEESTVQSAGDTVTITLPREVAKALLAALEGAV